MRLRSVNCHNLIRFSIKPTRIMSTFTTLKPRDATQEVSATGAFLRTASSYNNIISSDHPDFQPEFGRYHLYISLGCPWANRCFAMINMKKLQDCIGVTVVHPTWQRTRPNDPEDKHCGWTFFDSKNDAPLLSTSGHGHFHVDLCEPDPVNGAKFIRDLYEISGSKQTKYTVPVLFDKKLNTIVNNESSDILRMLNQTFNPWASGPFATLDLYPEEHRTEIDALNDWIYPGINNGVYRCGFAQSQQAYEQAHSELYQALDRVEAILANQQFLLPIPTTSSISSSSISSIISTSSSTSSFSVSSMFTEADLRLFMSLVRFDEVYVIYFKCSGKLIREYPNIRNYCREIYQLEGMRESISMQHIKTHYFTSHPQLNPFSIIPAGPLNGGVEADLQLPSTRL